MIQIKSFIEKVSYLEGKRAKDCVLNINDARGLRDEISTLLSDLYELQKHYKTNEVIEVQIKGASFK